MPDEAGMHTLGQAKPSPPTKLDAESIATLNELRAGREVTDYALDHLYPEHIRRLSSRFWTPVTVARKAARLCAPTPAARVLDMGAGVGRFCLIGTLVTGAEFVGVEYRRALVDIGCDVLEAAGATRAKLVYGTIDEVNFADFDAIYFYNPFEENLLEKSWHIDASVSLSHQRFAEDIRRAEEALGRARSGTRVVTYQGFGGMMPATYELVEENALGAKYLRLWVKRDRAVPGSEGTMDRGAHR